MSKVISFSVSDRYLDQIRSLYPGLSDNLAAKQFLTDRLDSSLSSSLDSSLDDGLDGKLKPLVESWVDGLLDERLDATVGKLIGSLNERLARLETRLDDGLDGDLDDGLDGSLDGNLDDGLDEMEPLLKLQREASIASPIQTGEPSPLPPSPDPIQGTDETDSSIAAGTDAIEPHPIETRQGLSNDQLSRRTNIATSTIEKWKGKIRKGETFSPTKYPDFFKQWTLNLADSLWYEVD